MSSRRGSQAASGDTPADADAADLAAFAEAVATAAVVPPGAATDERDQLRANLYYIAADLKRLAGQAPSHREKEILALSDLIASLASTLR